MLSSIVAILSIHTLLAVALWKDSSQRPFQRLETLRKILIIFIKRIDLLWEPGYVGTIGMFSGETPSLARATENANFTQNTDFLEYR